MTDVAQFLKSLTIVLQASGEWLLKMFAWLLVIGVLVEHHKEVLTLSSPATWGMLALAMYVFGSIGRAGFRIWARGCELAGSWRNLGSAAERPKPRPPLARADVVGGGIVALAVGGPCLYVMWYLMKPMTSFVVDLVFDVIWAEAFKDVFGCSPC